MIQLPSKAVHIQCLDHNGKPNATATGFIRQEEEMFFLYTCWHVVTGYNMYNLKVGHQPTNRWALKITLMNTTKYPGASMIGGNQSLTVQLYESLQTPRKPIWFQDVQEVSQPDLNSIGLRVPSWHDAVKIPLPENLNIHSSQLIVDVLPSYAPMIGDKLYVVGYPYGYSALGLDQPTPIVLTRHIAAMKLRDRKQEFLIDSAGAKSMSGSPVFVENQNGVFCIGLYTGLIYPDHIIEQNNAVTALGTCCNLQMCWWNPPGNKPLVSYEQASRMQW
jgi:hypothetical protein